MLELLITLLALSAVCILVWFASRRGRAWQKLSGQLTGPVEQMQEQILLTADTAVDRLDAKIAQMEILLAEIDRRSNLLAQQSQQLQMQQLHVEQQQQQFKEWVHSTGKKWEADFEARKAAIQMPLQLPVQQAPVTPVALQSFQPATQTRPKNEYALPDNANMKTRLANRGEEERAQAEAAETSQDKRAKIMELNEQGWSESDIAKKMGIGRGEVMLLLKLRKKTVQ